VAMAVLAYEHLGIIVKVLGDSVVFAIVSLPVRVLLGDWIRAFGINRIVPSPPPGNLRGAAHRCRLPGIEPTSDSTPARGHFEDGMREVNAGLRSRCDERPASPISASATSAQPRSSRARCSRYSALPM
jgi:hypothetical protein